ncbi:kynureninase [Catalinimonas alkaloidigena]|uniref:Kynureninase n=1 Tax=Catalinimonas alkaloidigena TaxID=1075417 RepID=A0A1G9F8Q0_9BACT|nr:kynureninase [Catalinimonas alkaloidigena]SDK84735.1 kynureninase [Catalinimonas alkaloidigena]
MSVTTHAFQNTLAYAQQCDAHDPLHRFRAEFHLPQHAGKPALYFCGNSLGLQPKSARAAVEQELDDWARLGVEGHFQGKNPWLYYHKLLQEPAARLVGAEPDEVVVMNSLTVNLHLMLISFYQPHREANGTRRFRILVEGGAFPSDQYALESQARLHGLDPDEAIVEVHPRTGEHTLRTEDLLATIARYGDELALVMMGGVNYYTGQCYDMAAITEAAHRVGAYAGFDLAHAAGNVVLRLHDWGVDFAVWCSYKYLNSGPGGTSGTFVHARHARNKELPRLAGWWGHNEAERFLMQKGFQPMPGAAGWQLSNAQIFPMAIHKASLEVFEAAGGMEALRAKSERLTGYLEFLLRDYQEHAARHRPAKALPEVQIITPSNPAERGCQLSLLVPEGGRALFQRLTERGVVADWREPDVIRVAPVPLYNTFEEVYTFVQLFYELWPDSVA